MLLPEVPTARVTLPGTEVALPLEVRRLPAVLGAGAIWTVFRGAAGPEAVGCRCRVEGVRLLGGGVRVLVAHGVARARGTRIGTDGMVAVVDEDPVGAGAEEARADAVRALRGYLAALAERGDRADVHVTIPTEPVAASHRVASLLRVSPPEVQFLLEAVPAAERLRQLAAVLVRERGLLAATMETRGA